MNEWLLITLAMFSLTDATHKAFQFVGFAIRYCQVMQVLEIIHPIMGFTKTSVPVAFLQVTYAMVTVIQP